MQSEWRVNFFFKVVFKITVAMMIKASHYQGSIIETSKNLTATLQILMNR